MGLSSVFLKYKMLLSEEKTTDTGAVLLFPWATNGSDILGKVVFPIVFPKSLKLTPSFSAPDSVSRSEALRLLVFSKVVIRSSFRRP